MTNFKLKIWRIFKKTSKYISIMIVLVLILAFITETAFRHSDQSRYPAPGKVIDIGTHELHIWCQGQGSPTIVLDAGAGTFSTSWRYVMETLAEHNQTCAFDRSGFGWSESGAGPYDGLQASRELHALLERADIDKPFVYVGHSLGAMLGQVYYGQYPQDLTGLVMIEPADPEIFIAEISEDRGEPVLRDAEIKACGLRCPMGMTAALLGVFRFAFSQFDIVNDPKFHPLALAEFKARTVRPEAVRMGLYSGRFLTTIAFQTGDVESFGELPIMLVHGSESGSLLGDSETLEDLENDRKNMLEAWTRTMQRSSNNLGFRLITGANHLSLVTYKEYAEQVAVAIREMVAFTGSNDGA